MKTQKPTLVNCGNDFDAKPFSEVCELLEAGKTAHVHVDCIGHTRNNTVQEIYKEKLEEKYGDRLWTSCNEGAFSTSYSYHLKAEIDGGAPVQCLTALREQAGLSKRKLSEYFGIPYRTIQNWESDLVTSQCPEYLLQLMEYKLRNEKLIP